MSAVVDRESAEGSPTEHHFVPGRGWVRRGPPAPPRSKKPKAAVFPPPGAAEGSLHVLKSPSGGGVTLAWRGDHWRHPSNPSAGNRLGWTPEHLGAAGWSHARVL